MPSPFPGMNPYLEQVGVWRDFHQSFVTELRAAIAQRVRPAYLAVLDHHVYVHGSEDDERGRLVQPDVHVVEDRERITTNNGGATTLAPPTIALLPHVATVDEVDYIEIRDREDRQLVTVVELLSPANKRAGADRDQYLSKRLEYTRSGTHLIEIDLLRGLQRMPLVDVEDCDYCVMVSRAEERPEVGVWPLGLRDPLPEIPIPLRAPDPDASVELQAVLHRVYDAAGYEDYIYRRRPSPLLRAADAAWAAEIVAGLGK
jgi:hypothetical protein